MSYHIFWISLCVFIASVLGVKLVCSLTTAKQDKTSLFQTVALVLWIVIFGGALSLGFFSGVDTQAGHYVFPIGGLAVLSGMVQPMRPIKKALIFWGICCLCACFLPTLPVKASWLTMITMPVGMGLVWAALIGVYVKMDRVPFLSMTLSGGFAVGYFCMAALFHIIPPTFGYFAIILLVAHIAVIQALKSRGILRLGTPAAVLFGFIWAGLGIHLAAMGHIKVLGGLYAYPLMEILFSALITFGIYHRWGLTYPFMVEQALSKNIFPDKVLRSIFLWEILLAMVATLSVMPSFTTYMYVLVISVVLTNAYIRLTSWGEPRPRFKDILSDFKDGMKQIKTQWQDLSQNIANTQKKVTTPSDQGVSALTAAKGASKHADTRAKKTHLPRKATHQTSAPPMKETPVAGAKKGEKRTVKKRTVSPRKKA
ncbi:MAG: hypothetical protein ACI4QM_05305 [Alphaproteobacteria bacterium]